MSISFIGFWLLAGAPVRVEAEEEDTASRRDGSKSKEGAGVTRIPLPLIAGRIGIEVGWQRVKRSWVCGFDPIQHPIYHTTHSPFLMAQVRTLILLSFHIHMFSVLRKIILSFHHLTSCGFFNRLFCLLTPVLLDVIQLMTPLAPHEDSSIDLVQKCVSLALLMLYCSNAPLPASLEFEFSLPPRQLTSIEDVLNFVSDDDVKNLGDITVHPEAQIPGLQAEFSSLRCAFIALLTREKFFQALSTGLPASSFGSEIPALGKSTFSSSFRNDPHPSCPPPAERSLAEESQTLKIVEQQNHVLLQQLEGVAQQLASSMFYSPYILISQLPCSLVVFHSDYAEVEAHRAQLLAQASFIQQASLDHVRPEDEANERRTMEQQVRLVQELTEQLQAAEEENQHIQWDTAPLEKQHAALKEELQEAAGAAAAAEIANAGSLGSSNKPPTPLKELGRKQLASEANALDNIEIAALTRLGQYQAVTAAEVLEITPQGDVVLRLECPFTTAQGTWATAHYQLRLRIELTQPPGDLSQESSKNYRVLSVELAPENPNSGAPVPKFDDLVASLLTTADLPLFVAELRDRIAGST